MLRRFTTLVAASLVAAACSETPTEAPDKPELQPPVGAAFAYVGAKMCPRALDYVVTTEVELNAALASAIDGDVIGLDGMIGLTGPVGVFTPGLTLTCATPGSGVFDDGVSGTSLLAVGDRTTVEHLVMDGKSLFLGALNATLADDVRFSNNTVTCGVACVFFHRSRDATIVENTFVGAGGFSAVQVQSESHGAVISGNTIEGNEANWGIRVSTGSNDVVVSHNVIHGSFSAFAPVAAAITATSGSDRSLIFSNRVLATANFGIWINIADGSVVRNNEVTEGAEFGVVVQGCNNALVGNNANTVVFAEDSGANVFAGNGGTVTDDGAFDCDGDGFNDPNIITGAGAVLHGANLGDLVSEAVSTPLGPMY